MECPCRNIGYSRSDKIKLSERNYFRTIVGIIYETRENSHVGYLFNRLGKLLSGEQPPILPPSLLSKSNVLVTCENEIVKIYNAMKTNVDTSDQTHRDSSIFKEVMLALFVPSTYRDFFKELHISLIMFGTRHLDYDPFGLTADGLCEEAEEIDTVQWITYLVDCRMVRIFEKYQFDRKITNKKVFDAFMLAITPRNKKKEKDIIDNTTTKTKIQTKTPTKTDVVLISVKPSITKTPFCNRRRCGGGLKY